MRSIFSFLFSALFFSLAPSVRAQPTFSPTVTYLEDILEKEVAWPVAVAPMEKDAAKQGPRLQVWIGLPDLVKLTSMDPEHQIYDTSLKPAPFPQFKGVHHYIYFQTNQAVTLFKLKKENSESSSKDVALKVSFPADAFFVTLSPKCRRKWVLKNFAADSPLRPFLTRIECVKNKKIRIKISPEMDFVDGKKQLNYSVKSYPLKAAEDQSALTFTSEITQKEQKGNLTFSLRLLGDVIDQFEANPLSGPYGPPDKESNIYDLNLKGLSALGFTLSKRDPEIFAHLNLRHENWKYFVELGGTWSLPFLMSGVSQKNLINGEFHAVLTKPFHRQGHSPKYGMSLGLAARQKSERENLDGSVQWGPQLKGSLEKLKVFSFAPPMGIHLSLTPYGRDFASDLDIFSSVALKEGRLFEPHLILQDLRFDKDHSNDFTIKIGMAARW